MKKILFTICILTLSNCFVSAQDTVYLKKEGKKKTFTDRAPQAFYAELGGAGISLSVNYDRRFNKRTDGLGFRIGTGYSFDNYFKFVTVPLGINYLIGNNQKGRFLDVGLNFTPIFLANSTNNNFFGGNGWFIDDINSDKKTLFFTGMNIGYRSQPTRGGFNFRGGLMPFIVSNQTGVGGYLSFGYNF